MRGDGVLFSAEGASRAGLGCCTSPLASNFRSEKASTMLGAAIDVAAVEKTDVLAGDKKSLREKLPLLKLCDIVCPRNGFSDSREA